MREVLVHSHRQTEILNPNSPGPNPSVLERTIRPCLQCSPCRGFRLTVLPLPRSSLLLHFCPQATRELIDNFTICFARFRQIPAFLAFSKTRALGQIGVHFGDG